MQDQEDEAQKKPYPFQGYRALGDFGRSAGYSGTNRRPERPAARQHTHGSSKAVGIFGLITGGLSRD